MNYYSETPYGDQMPIETADAQAWFQRLNEIPERYPFENVATEMELTPREIVNAAIWVAASGGVIGLAIIGAVTVVRWLIR